jgi:predicted alpha/beta-hydrolase family hydrolase
VEETAQYSPFVVQKNGAFVKIFTCRWFINAAAPKPDQIRTAILAGLTVSLALVTETVAFAFVAGAHPLVGR